jgi:stress-induced-phosphoprotein 1
LFQAKEKDKDGKNAREIGDLERKAVEATYTERAGETDEQRLQRAMRDPEVQVRRFFFPLRAFRS